MLHLFGTSKFAEGKTRQAIDELHRIQRQIDKQALVLHMSRSKDAQQISIFNRQSAQREAILNSLKSFDYQFYQSKLQRVRHPNTCHWILSHPRFQDWLLQSGSSTLACLGSIGSGKSVMTSSVINLLQGQRENVALCYHFCSLADKRTLDMENIFNSLSRQLLLRKDIPEDLETLVKSQDQIPNPSTFQRSVNTFEYVCNSERQIYLLIDGLDELLDNDQTTLINSLQNLVRRHQNIKVWMSGRRENYRLRHAFARSSVIFLSEELINHDLCLFIRDSVKSKIDKHELIVGDHSTQELIVSVLEAKVRDM